VVGTASTAILRIAVIGGVGREPPRERVDSYGARLDEKLAVLGPSQHGANRLARPTVQSSSAWAATPDHPVSGATAVCARNRLAYSLRRWPRVRPGDDQAGVRAHEHGRPPWVGR
jgi:hypothetical protein